MDKFTRRTTLGTLFTTALQMLGNGAKIRAQETQPAAAAALVQRMRVDGRSAYSSVQPAAAWNGTAGSGFASPPTDPLRTTAKPACRLVVPPNQAFTDYLVVGVSAFANDFGTLENFGLKSVIFHYEGRSSVISTPSLYSFEDANGRTVSYFGWWCVLLHDRRHGEAQLYVEAVPNDATMQSRVIGPYLFLPSPELHDLELEVAPSSPVIAGQRYRTITDALAWCARNGRHHPLIRITEARRDYLISSIPGPKPYTGGKGYVTIEATVPVTIIGTKAYADATPRPRYSGIHFKGENICLDMATADRYFHERGGNQYWYDGVTVRNSAGRSQIMATLGGPRPSGFASGQPWLTECKVSDLPIPAMRANLVRGCVFTRCFSDAVGEALCVVASRFDDFDSYIDWAKDVPALTVTYSGPGETATLELSGDNNAAHRTFAARVDGVLAGSFITDRFYTAGTGRNSSVVRWLNALPGWVATLQDDTRRASVLSKVGGKGGGFRAINCKAEPLQLVTMFDYHGDFYQQNSPATSTTENVVVADNTITNFAGQCFFLSSRSVARDFVFVNNTFHGKPGGSGYNVRQHFFSQLDRRGEKSHIIFAHNAMTQGWLLRTSGGFHADRYCLWANNACKSIEWTGIPDANIRVINNHLFAGSSVPKGATGTSVGGSDDQIWQAPDRGDFTPRGALLANLKVPALKRDILGRRVVGRVAAGALVRPRD